MYRRRAPDRAIRPPPAAAGRGRARVSYLHRLHVLDPRRIGGLVAITRPQVVVEDPFHLAERRDRVQLFAQLSRARKALYVPAEMLSELDGRTARIGLVVRCHS